MIFIIDWKVKNILPTLICLILTCILFGRGIDLFLLSIIRLLICMDFLVQVFQIICNHKNRHHVLFHPCWVKTHVTLHDPLENILFLTKPRLPPSLKSSSENEPRDFKFFFLHIILGMHEACCSCLSLASFIDMQDPKPVKPFSSINQTHFPPSKSTSHHQNSNHNITIYYCLDFKFQPTKPRCPPSKSSLENEPEDFKFFCLHRIHGMDEGSCS